MKSICVATFPDLYVLGWLSRFLKYVFPRSRLNARAYSRVRSPSTSGSGLPYPMPPCTSLYPLPARPTWPFQSPHGIRNSNPGILALTARSWSKNRSWSLIPSLRLLCGAYTDRKVTTRWPIISFTKMILSETLCTSKTFSIHSSATNAPTLAVPLSFRTSRACTGCPCPWLCGSCHHGICSPEYSIHPLSCGIVFPLPHSSSHSVYIECSHPEFPQVLAWFATMVRPCLPHLTGGRAGDVTNRTLMSIGTT